MPRGLNAPSNVRFWQCVRCAAPLTPPARTYLFNSKKRRLSAPGLREQCRFWVNVTPLRPAIYIPSHL
jgi:hypothetical protein